MKLFLLTLTVIIATPCVFSESVFAENWPGWRGPGGMGVSSEASVPVQWSATEAVRWRVTVPGYGWSSPIVWGGKVFVTAAIASPQDPPDPHGPGSGTFVAPDVYYRWEVHCYDRLTGELLWSRVAAERKPAISIHPSNTYASETPVTDGERIRSEW